MKFKQYKRKGLSEMILLKDFTGEMSGISVSAQDGLLDHEEFNKGYVARNPKNHLDMWYVSKKYFDDNLEPAEKETSFLERLIDEKNELEVKSAKLASFLSAGKFQNVEEVQVSLLRIQLSAMRTYSQCLLERLIWLQK